MCSISILYQQPYFKWHCNCRIPTTRARSRLNGNAVVQTRYICIWKKFARQFSMYETAYECVGLWTGLCLETDQFRFILNGSSLMSFVNKDEVNFRPWNPQFTHSSFSRCRFNLSMPACPFTFFTFTTLRLHFNFKPNDSARRRFVLTLLCLCSVLYCIWPMFTVSHLTQTQTIECYMK